MAKLANCPIKTYSCVPVPEYTAGLNRHTQSAQAMAGVTGPAAPKPVLGKMHRAWKRQQFSTPMALPGMLTKLAAGQVLQSQINTRLG